MVPNKIVAAALSTDRDLLVRLREVVGENGSIVLATEVALPFAEVSREELSKLRETDPRLIFIDLEEDPELGIRLAKFLAEGNPQRMFVGVGPVPESALLLEAMKAGIVEYLPKPVEPDDLNAAIKRMERRFLGVTEAAAPKAPGEVFAVFSPKGGSGSTTVATNMAIHLHQLTGKKTLLVDLDLELGEIAVLLGVQPRFNFVDMIRNFHRMDTELLASYIEKHDSGVHLLSAPFHPEKVEVVPGEGIRKILAFLKNHYEYIVVDTSKSFTPATLATFEQADRIFLLINVDLPSLRNIKRCQPLLDRIVGADQERIRLVVNRYHINDVISLEEVERTIGMQVFATLSNDYESVIRSINTGQPVINNEKSPFARDLRALASEVAGVSPSKNGHNSRLPSWVKVFSRRTVVKG